MDKSDSPVPAVDGHVEHARVALENVLRAVPVVHVPVEDEHLFGASPLGGPGGHGSVVEEAEAHGHAALCMVPGRPHNGSSMGSLPSASTQ